MKKINLPFGWKAYIFICSKEELEKESKKIKLKFEFSIGEDHKVNGFMEFVKQNSPKPDIFALWINSIKEKEINYLLIHELHHLVFEYCKHLGIRDEEFEAYLLEDICRQLKLFEGENEKTKN